MDIQSIVDAVYSYHTDASKYSDKQTLLNYLTNSFDHYVQNSTLESTSSRIANNFLYRHGKNPNEDTLYRRKNVYNSNDSENDFDNENDGAFSDYNDEDMHEKHKKSTLKKTLEKVSRISKVLCITKGKRYGNYLLALFVFVKVLYSINSIFQLFMLNHFLGNDFLVLGVEVLNKIWNGDDWTQLQRFPRVTMCDFRIREVGIVHRYTVQCVLSINLFNEKIFIFLWFWLCLVSIFNVWDLISWSYTLIINSHERYSYVKRRLNALNTINKNLSDPENRTLFKKFVNHYLKEDGVLALRLLSRNSQDLIVSEIINNLYELYRKQQRQKLIQLSKKVKEANLNDDQASEKNGLVTKSSKCSTVSETEANSPNVKKV